MSIKSLIRAAQFYINKIVGDRYVSVHFSDLVLKFDTHWKHEFDYTQYCKHGTLNGPICLDLWAMSHLIKEGDVVLDAGANIGFTATLSKKAKAREVHCFEPDPRLFKRLVDNCNDDLFRHEQIALSKSDSTGLFHLSQQHNQGSTLSDIHLEKFSNLYNSENQITVTTKKVDTLYSNKKFDFLKIDVEGEELNLLKGAKELLSNQTPRIVYIELYEEYFTEAYRFLTSFFDFAYRVICDQKGRGKLVKITSEELMKIDIKKIITRPPTFVFTTENLDTYTTKWTMIK
jgi:FkbM family methyltransferase